MMEISNLVSILIFSPLLGILLLLLLPKNQDKWLKVVGVLGTIPALFITIYLYYFYSTGGDLNSLAESFRWIQFKNNQELSTDWVINYQVSMDGLSLVLVLLTTIVSTLAAIASVHIKKDLKGYFLLFLLLEIGMIGVFTAQNLFLFFMFFELTLIPMFFLISRWGYVEREKAAYYFLIYNGLGSALLLIVIIAIFAKTGTTQYDLLSAMSTTNDSRLDMLSGFTRMGFFIALFIALGVKLPIFPLHSWMLRVHVQAPPAVVMIHSGILLKIGGYGLIRFGMYMFPNEFNIIGPAIAILGVINLLYGAYLALIQTDLKLVLAYSSISHMGIVLMGIAAQNYEGVQGAIFQLISHGLISAILFFLVSILYERTNSSELHHISGLSTKMPLAAGFILAASMASLGLPGMSGFISEFLAYLGLFKTFPWIAAVGTLGLILTAAYLLRASMEIVFGKANENENLYDIRGVEFIPVLTLMLLILSIGIYPNLIASPIQSTIQILIVGFGG